MRRIHWRDSHPSTWDATIRHNIQIIAGRVVGFPRSLSSCIFLTGPQRPLFPRCWQLEKCCGRKNATRDVVGRSSIFTTTPANRSKRWTSAAAQEKIDTINPFALLSSRLRHTHGSAHGQTGHLLQMDELPVNIYRQRALITRNQGPEQTLPSSLAVGPHKIGEENAPDGSGDWQSDLVTPPKSRKSDDWNGQNPRPAATSRKWKKRKIVYRLDPAADPTRSNAPQIKIWVFYTAGPRQFLYITGLH